MGILIILLFALIFTSVIVLCIPRKVALRISGINQYDLHTVPTKTVLWTYIISSFVLAISVVLLFFILKDQISPVPAFIETFLEWIHG